MGPASLSGPLRFVHTGSLSIAVDALLGYCTAISCPLRIPRIRPSAETYLVYAIGLRLRLRVGCVSSWRLRHLLVLFVSISSLA